MNLQDLQKGIYTPFHLDGVPNESNFTLQELTEKLRDRRIINSFEEFVPISWEEYNDIIHYLYSLKWVSEEPPLGKKPDYVPLSFQELSEMVTEPVYVKVGDCKGHWEIIRSVEKDEFGAYVRFKGFDDQRMRIENNFYRTKEGAEDGK